MNNISLLATLAFCTLAMFLGYLAGYRRGERSSLEVYRSCFDWYRGQNKDLWDRLKSLSSDISRTRKLFENEKTD